jgi:hypothetical protein
MLFLLIRVSTYTLLNAISTFLLEIKKITTIFKKKILFLVYLYIFKWHIL